MKTMRQLLRQPIKTLFGILLAAMAVAALTVCLGQSFAAAETAKQLDYDFTTIALPTGNYNRKLSTRYPGTLQHTNYMNKEVAAWVEEVIAQHPELVEGRSYTGLASACIPELVGDHPSNYDSLITKFGKREGNGQYVSAQDCAMLVVTLEEIGEPEEMQHNRTLNDPDPVTGEDIRVLVTDKVTVPLQARIDKVLCLPDSQRDPTGWTIYLTLETASLEELEAMHLQVGQQYIVNGMDYFDNGRLLGEYVQQQLEGTSWTLGPYEKKNLYILTEEEKALWSKSQAVNLFAVYCEEDLTQGGLASVWDSRTGKWLISSEKRITIANTRPANTELIANYYTAKMTLANPAGLNDYSFVDGSVLQTREITVNGEKKVISWDEYKALYSVPTIAPLTGSAEDFLAENQFWRDWLECQSINTHAFPVYAVDKLDYIADFNRGQAHIIQGRDFTKAELESGAKVCVISETLAQINGLSVGDTISPQFYDLDENSPILRLLSVYFEQANPVYFIPGSEFAGPAEKYTVVGIYRQTAVWEDPSDNKYGFTPNTIFVPKTSVNAPMEYCEMGLFNVLVLKNGAQEAFDAIVLDKKFETMALPTGDEKAMFVYFDQGYLAVSRNISSYAGISQRVLVVGIVVYAILTLLFMLLYPLRQGKALRTMAVMGTSRWVKIRYVLLSALGILLPGAAAGMGLGICLWGTVVGRLLTISGASMTLSINVLTLLAIVVAQLVLAMLLVALLAIPMTRHSNLMKRK